MELVFINNQKEEIGLEGFERLLKKASEIFENLKKTELKLNLVIIDDEEIQNLNREYRGIDKSTDVLSFTYVILDDMDAPKEIEDCIGEIFISLQTAKNQALEKNHSLEREMEILFVHGLLHVLGFDHRNDEEEEEMEGWATRILE